MNATSVLFGAFKHEFRMQIRRRAVWITLAIFAVVTVLLIIRNANEPGGAALQPQMNLNQLVGHWSGLVMLFTPIAIGCLLADRLPRDRKTKVEELFTSMPGSLGARLFGKYVGTTVATLIPVLIFYCLGIGYILYLKHDVMVLVWALTYFSATMIPGILFVSGFSIACPAVIWVPLYQFLYIGYWFWGNILSVEGFPTLRETILAPIGSTAQLAFFNPDPLGPPHATPLQGVESILVLIGLGILAVLAAWALLAWQRDHQ